MFEITKYFIVGIIVGVGLSWFIDKWIRSFLQNLDNNEKKTYKIVGKDEADIKKNFIYFRSPIGKALIGKKKKEFVTVNTPAGEKNFEIIDVKYI